MASLRVGCLRCDLDGKEPGLGNWGLGMECVLAVETGASPTRTHVWLPKESSRKGGDTFWCVC